jgi:hypothetical protein
VLFFVGVLARGAATVSVAAQGARRGIYKGRPASIDGARERELAGRASIGRCELTPATPQARLRLCR